MPGSANIVIIHTHNHNRETHQYPTIRVHPPIESKPFDAKVVERVRPLLLVSTKNELANAAVRQTIVRTFAVAKARQIPSLRVPRLSPQ